jgi:hypothetical protein
LRRASRRRSTSTSSIAVLPFGKSLIGTYDAELEDLVHKCEDGKGEYDPRSFYLHGLIHNNRGKDCHHTTEPIGQIKIMLCGPNADVAAASALVVAHKDAGNIGTSAVATVTGYIDEAQGVQSNAFSGLESVLANINVFVKIVDEPANVRDNCYL